MSIHEVPGGWEVRWRQGNRQRSRKFTRRGDALTFDREVKRMKQLGTLADLDAGTELLSDFAAEWFVRSAQGRLADSTLEVYTHVWDHHILGRLGDYQLRQLTPALIEDELIAPMVAKRVGGAMQRKALLLLQGVLLYAVRRERIPRNPAEAVERPKVARSTIRPLPLIAIERCIFDMSHTDGMLVELMGYQGNRPGEALALTDAAVRDRTLLVDSGVALGKVGQTKTRRARTIRLVGPVARDMAAYMLATRKHRREQHAAFRARVGARVAGASPLLFPAPEGGPWDDSRWRNWRRRTWRPAIRKALELPEWEPGVKRQAPTPRPYDLRHTYVSMLIAAGRPIGEVADQAGHSVAVCASTYTHVFEEWLGADTVPVEDRIRAARAQVNDERQETG